MAGIFKETVNHDECIVTDLSAPLVDVYCATFIGSQDITHAISLPVSWELLEESSCQVFSFEEVPWCELLVLGATCRLLAFL